MSINQLSAAYRESRISKTAYIHGLRLHEITEDEIEQYLAWNPVGYVDE